MDRSPPSTLLFLRYAGNLLWAGILVLWRIVKLGDDLTGRVVFILVLLGIGAGIGTAVTSYFRWLPWEVSAAIFLVLLFYGLCRASHEEVGKADEKRKRAEQKSEELGTELQRTKREQEQVEERLEAVEAERDELKAEQRVQVAVEAQAQSSSVPFPPPHPLPPSVAAQLWITNRSFQITELVRGGNTILNRTFESCTIHGPAVLILQGPGEMTGNTFVGEDKEAMYWELDETREKVVGAIAAVGCTFRRCTFVGIGLAGPPALIRMFREGTD